MVALLYLTKLVQIEMQYLKEIQIQLFYKLMQAQTVLVLVLQHLMVNYMLTIVSYRCTTCY